MQPVTLRPAHRLDRARHALFARAAAPTLYKLEQSNNFLCVVNYLRRRVLEEKMTTASGIANISANSPDDEKDRTRQAAILKLWEAYDLLEDDVARQLIAFAIDRLVG